MMRKAFRTMLAVMLVFCLLGSAAGCTGGSNTDEGYWVITAYREEGETYKGDELPKIGCDGYLVLESGGTGFLMVGKRAYEIAWGAGKIECASFGLDFAREGSVLTAYGRRANDMEGIVYTFEKSKESTPVRPSGIISVDDAKHGLHESSAAESSQESEEESFAEESAEESLQEESLQEESAEESSQAESSKEESSKAESSVPTNTGDPTGTEPGNIPGTIAELPEFLQIANPSPGVPKGGYVVTAYFIDGDEYEPDGNGIVFNENGVGELNFTGEIETVFWAYENGVLSIEASDGTYLGTLADDGIMRLADSYYDDYYYTLEAGTPNFALEGPAADRIEAIMPFIGEYQGFLHVYNTAGFGGYLEDGTDMISQLFARIGVNSDGTPFAGFQTFYDPAHAFTLLQAEYSPEDEVMSVTGQLLGIPFGADFTQPDENGVYRIAGSAAEGGVSYDYEIILKSTNADWTIEEVPTYSNGEQAAYAANYVDELARFKGENLETRLKEYAAALDPDGEIDLSVFQFDKNVYNVEMNGAGPDTQTVQYLDDEKKICWMYDSAVFQASEDQENGLMLTADNGTVYIFIELSTGRTALDDYVELIKQDEADGIIDHLVMEDLTLGPYSVKKLYYRIAERDVYGADYLVVLDEEGASGYYGVDVIVYDTLQRPEMADTADIRNLISSLQVN